MSEDIVTIKMSQVDRKDLFGEPPESWTQEDPEDPAQYMTDPTQYEKTEEAYAKEIAKQWKGRMIRIGPNFYMDSYPMEVLSGLIAMGFDISSKEKILELSGLFVDESVLTDHLSWLNDDEWRMLLAYLTGQPQLPKVGISLSMSRLAGVMSMRHIVAQSDIDMQDLLQAMGNLQLEMDAKSPKTMKVLQLLSKSPISPLATIATSILGLSPEQRIKLFDEAISKLQEEAFSKLPPLKPEQPSQLTLEQPPGEMPVEEEPVEKEEEVSELVSPPMTVERPPESTVKQEEPSKQLEMIPSVPAMPSKEQSEGAKATNKQLKDFVSRYEELVVGNPSYTKSLGWGDSSGVRILGMSGPGQDVARGGMLLKNYDTKEDGIITGVLSDGSLMVRTIPGGTPDSWDPRKNEIRVSMHHGKFKPEGY